MYLQLPHIFLLMAAGPSFTTASRIKGNDTLDVATLSSSNAEAPVTTQLKANVVPPKLRSRKSKAKAKAKALKEQEKSAITGTVTIQTSPPTPTTSTSSGLYTIQISPPTPTLEARSIEDWYSDNHRQLNKFGRFVFRLTRFGKRVFLQLTSTVEHKHDPNDEMIDISNLTTEGLDALIHGLNLTAIVDHTKNSTTYLNGTKSVADIVALHDAAGDGTVGSLLRRSDLSPPKPTLHYTDTPAPSPPRLPRDILRAYFRHIGYSIKALFVSEMLDERAQRERLATGKITQYEFDVWLKNARAEPPKFLPSTSGTNGTGKREKVNPAYTRWAFIKAKYAKRPWEFIGGRKGELNPDYVAYDIQQSEKTKRPARYFFNGTRSQFYPYWQEQNMKKVGATAKWLEDGTVNPGYVERMVRTTDFGQWMVQPFEWNADGRLNPDYLARELQDAKRQGRPSRWDVEGTPNEQFYVWEEEQGKKEEKGKRELIVPDFDAENEGGEENWEAWEAIVRAGNKHGKRQLAVPDFDAENEDGADDWEAWKASVRAGNSKRQLVVPDFDAENEDGEDDWEAWKAMVRAGKTGQKGKREVPIPDVEEGEKESEIEQEWRNFVEKEAKELFFPSPVHGE